MKSKAIITSALPYANGEIHLGHVASTYLPADVTTRFLKMNDVEAYYICASDDFGTPILIQSEKEGTTPAEYVKRWNKRDYEDFAALDINFDYFYRTSSPENVEFAQQVFKKLHAAGHIYEKEIIQFYCKNDKKFLPDRYVKGTCPHCNAGDQYSDLCESCGRIPEEILHPICAICGQSPSKEKTTHYFFKLRNFADVLYDWLERNENLQKDVKKYVQNWIRSGLRDWDITRDISWGVPIPLENAKGKVLYGWFDNHLAYISSTMKFLEEKGIKGKEFWNSADIYHFIGKDIVYHHYLFLPAMRLGIDKEYKLPEYIPTRGHLTLQSKKISKSRNWYIGLREFLNYYPSDYLRYYLIVINPYSQDDLNFDWGEFAARINSELIGNVGNFVNRALGFTTKTFDGKIPEPTDLGGENEEAILKIKSLADKIGNLITGNYLDRALRGIMEFSSFFNQYFQHNEPWKGGSNSQNCIFISVNAVQSLAIALYPFIPSSAQKIWEQLGLEHDIANQKWKNMTELSMIPGHTLGKVQPLFSRVEDHDIETYKNQLGKQPH